MMIEVSGQMTSNLDPQNSHSTSSVNYVNETADTLLSETNAVFEKELCDVELSPSSWDTQVDTQLPLLPRSGWQNQETFLRILIRAKRSLILAEINAYLVVAEKGGSVVDKLIRILI